MAIKYGGKTTPDYSAMRGPCLEGYHIPMYSEWQNVLDILTTIGYDNDSKKALCFMIVLLMPFAGQRDYSTSNPQNQDGISYGIYWCSTNNYRCLDVRGTSVQFKNYYKGYGYLIRPFKDVAVVPDSSWTKVDSYQVAIGGIYSNTTLGLISLSGDGTNWITITDKNLGATEVYDMNSGYYTEANCGKYFQWGNNYGFPFTGSLTTSSTQVDASSYGPGNYYNSSTFITQQNWDSSTNNNLWGGVTGIIQRPVNLVKKYYGGKLINDMQGPAPYGFHIPTVDEWEGVKDIMDALYLTEPDDWGINLHMPYVGHRSSSSEYISGQGANYYYWSSSSESPDMAKALYLSNFGGIISADYSDARTDCIPIRAFKDSYVEATDSWTVITGLVGNAGIFWNQSEGLITISDGAWGYTIMDKNLGATTVYNYRDTLTQANMGNMYQWGNNYGFPSTGSISNTSSTQVDASNYGPNTDNGYYSSDTFITGSSDWSSVHNDNLWGGVTQGQHPVEVKKVYYGSTQIRPNEEGEIYIIDLTESYSNTIPAGNTINNVKILLDNITAPSAFINIGSGNNGLSFVGSGMGMPGGAWINISTYDLSGTIEYDFNTSVVSFDLTGGGNHQSGSQQFSYWTIDESIDELISYTISQWGDPSSGTIKISIERDTNNSSIEPEPFEEG